MDGICRDEITSQLQGYYSRRVFFGDITLKDIKDLEIRKSVEKELKDTGLDYLC